MSCGESLVSSVTQTTLPDLRQTGRPDCVGFSRPFRSLNLPNGTVRILAEPSNNSNLRAERQLFRPVCGYGGNIAQAAMQPQHHRAAREFAMLGFSHDF